MVEFFIETNIDKFIDLLRKKKRVRISEAAKILKVTQKQVDEWVFTLEDKGIVNLKYPVLGEPEAVLIEETPEDATAETKKDIEIDTRIIPGKPIKKSHLPKFKLSKVLKADTTFYKEEPQKQEEMLAPEYNEIVNELKSLQEKISRMASKRSEEANPSSLYVNEKLKFLEGKLHQLSKRTEDENKLYETERVILEKIEAIEKRLKKESKKKKKLEISGTNNV
jgi:uncharacterized protein with GYD domain